MKRILIIGDQSIPDDEIKSIMDGKVVAISGDTNDTAEIRNLYRKFEPDLTIVDTRNQGTNGLGTIRIIKEVDPSARIIIISNAQQNVQIHESMKSGAVAYIIKPKREDNRSIDQGVK